jgi:hypothetical protein
VYLMASVNRRVGQWVQQTAWPHCTSGLARQFAILIGIPLVLTVVVVVWFSLNFPLNTDTRQAQRQSQGGAGAFAGGYNGTLEYCRVDCESSSPP